VISGDARAGVTDGDRLHGEPDLEFRTVAAALAL